RLPARSLCKGMNMALLKRTSPAEPYRVPSLSESDETYAGLVAKKAELLDKQSAHTKERRELEKAIASDTSRDVRPAIAELLGDAPGTKALNRRRLAEVHATLRDIEAAMVVVDQRIRDAKTAASRAVCAAVRPEYAARVKAMVDAMRTLDGAHRAYDDLRHQLEMEDVSWGSLMPMTPAFLGESNEPDRRIARFIREAEAAGYGD
ncbi:hypothetical protein AB4144_11430, partial [Rhizobiaceae sp. 2RAB30]